MSHVVDSGAQKSTVATPSTADNKAERAGDCTAERRDLLTAPHPHPPSASPARLQLSEARLCVGSELSLRKHVQACGKPFRGPVLPSVTKKPGQASSELGGHSVQGQERRGRGRKGRVWLSREEA